MDLSQSETFSAGSTAQPAQPHADFLMHLMSGALITRVMRLFSPETAVLEAERSSSHY